MADFRRSIFAFIVVGLLLGATTTMYAQGPAFACTANAGVPPILRSEGLTELMGDIVINCTGGTAVTGNGTLTGAGAVAIPTANITVFVNTQVTSRILASGTAAGDVSEALLMIDEPGAAGSPVTTMNVCPSVLGCSVAGPAAATTNPFIAGANTFQGTVSGNAVTFLGVPVDPPGTTGTRVFRITNVRVNASALAPSGAIPGQVTASVSSSGSTSIPISNPTVVTGFTQQGLTFAVRNAANNAAASAGDRTFLQCVDVNNIGNANKVANLFLRFNEGFQTAWKLRINPVNGLQNVPGTIYNTESGFIPSGFTTAGSPTTAGNGGPNSNVAGAGLADFATRIKATFNNIPAGVSVFVPVTLTSGRGTVAQLTLAETAPFVAVASTDKFGGTTDVAPVTLTNGAGTAVWEITANNAVVADQLDASVWFVYTANPGAGSPALGTGTVNGSFAPTYDLTTTPNAAKAQTSLFPIPRFVVVTNPANLITIVICRTNLLFPYLASVSGFDTGIAIANTSSDPFGTTAQSGTCALSFFGTGAPSVKTIGPIAGGVTSTLLGSTDFPNFQGYMIAVCNFQFAHGFAFISDLGARNWGTVYLASIIPDVRPRFAGQLTDLVTGESLGQ